MTQREELALGHENIGSTTDRIYEIEVRCWHGFDLEVASHLSFKN